MSIAQTSSRIETQSPAIRIPRPPRLRLGQFLLKALAAYAETVSMSFGAAMGAKPDAPTRHGSTPDQDY